MDIKGKLTEKQQDQPRGMIARDLHRVREDGRASAEELRQFMGELRGRSPQEMLGAVAQSDLVRSTLAAVVLTAILLGALTFGPWAMARDKDADKDANKKDKTVTSTAANPGDAAAKGDQSTSAGADADKGSATSGPASTSTGTGKAADATAGKTGKGTRSGKAGLAKTLGIDDVKTGDPDIDPFENADDDLLKIKP